MSDSSFLSSSAVASSINRRGVTDTVYGASHATVTHCDLAPGKAWPSPDDSEDSDTEWTSLRVVEPVARSLSIQSWFVTWTSEVAPGPSVTVQDSDVTFFV